MKSNPFARRVNVERLRPVVDLFRSHGAAELDECPPACPTCGGEALWFTELDTNRVELVCLDCAPDGPTTDAPEVDEPGASAVTTEQLKRHARRYADEYFPGWHGVTIRVRMGDRSTGGHGELLLVLTNPAFPAPHRPESTGNKPSAPPLLDGVQTEPVADASAAPTRE